MLTPETLLDDGPLLAVNKPAGLATQAPSGIPSLESAVKSWLKEKHQKPGNVYLGVPHRLDRPVSGVVVFAKNSKAAARLAEQFAERRVQKVYWAIVEGAPPERAGMLRDQLKKVPDEARAIVTDQEDPEGREAMLSYRVLQELSVPETASRASLLEIELGTGRMHQIRVQFASRGCPIVGDTKYGASLPWSPVEVSEESIALHARELTLFHPIRYDQLTLTAPLPEAWRRIVSVR